MNLIGLNRTPKSALTYNMKQNVGSFIENSANRLTTSKKPIMTTPATATKTTIKYNNLRIPPPRSNSFLNHNQ